MPSVEEIRATRPREVGVARVLLIVAVVLWLPIAGTLFAATSSAGLVDLALIFVVFGSFGVVRGRRAGRTMVTVALAVNFLMLAPYCVAGFHDDSLTGPGYAPLDIASVLLSITALVLLYQSRTSRYLHLVGVARQRRS
ncbi:MAG TPA: hypothetical protein VGP26_11815 [Actinophytocola sp.]|nr:hypothetical protein [Actinophytocola sp.]